MQSSEKTVSHAPQVEQNVYKDEQLEKHKKNYLHNRRWTIILAVAAILITIAAVIIENLRSKQNLTTIPAEWRLESKMSVDSSGQLVAVSTLTDSLTRRILLSTDSGMHFALAGGPWPNCENELMVFSVAPDNRSLIAADGSNFFIKAATSDSFVRIALDFTVRGTCFVPGSDSVYVFGSQKIMALSYVDPDSIRIYEAQLYSYEYIESLAADNSPNRTLKAIISSDWKQPETIKEISLNAGTVYVAAAYSKPSNRNVADDWNQSMDTTTAVAADSSKIQADTLNPKTYAR